jgi:putative endopeptidase
MRKSSSAGRKLFSVIMSISLMSAVSAQNTSGLPDFSINLKPEEITAQPRPQDDFYQYANYDWFRNMKRPADHLMYGSFDIVADSVNMQLAEITETAAAAAAAGKASRYEKNIAALYSTISDRDGREKAGLGTLKPYLERIEKCATVQEYVDTMFSICMETGTGIYCGFGIGGDPFENKRYVISLCPPATGTGRQYFENPANAPGIESLKKYYGEMLVLYGRDAGTARTESEQIIGLIRDLALHSMYKYESMNPANNRRLDIDGVEKLYSNVNVREMLEAGKIGPSQGISEWYVNAYDLISYFNTLLTPEHLGLIREATIASMLVLYSGSLSPEYENSSLSFQKSFTGTEAKPQTERDMEMCENLLSDTYGRIYPSRYFSPDMRKEVISYVRKIQEQYKKTLSAVSWMSPATKKKALLKLDKMAVNIGYSENYCRYIDTLSLTSSSEGGCLIDNVLSMQSESQKYFRKLAGKKVDRSILPWTPQTVNAFYNPFDNSINFPAAILQSPFYDKNASEAENLGGVGMVIAHEITHCFDSLGSKYDENGAVRNWWTDEDRNEYTARQKKIADFYTRYHLSDGAYVNGANTLGENIADLGSLGCITAIIGPDSGKLAEAYMSFARLWKEEGTPEFYSAIMEADEHTISAVRVDAVLSSIPEFYTVFDVKEGDAMYVPPEDRVKLW